jgi:transcriptional regulator with GAF, ATPase, and Fis domain
VKLLRALQDGQIQRVGDTQPHQVDVRILAATNRDLEKEVEDGRFRQALFYRLRGVDIRTPPLWERRDDIPLLARHFLSTYREKNAAAPVEFSPDTIDILGRYPWPGNVRELQKEVERAATLASGEASIDPSHLSARVTGPASALPPETGSGISLDQLEHRHIQGVLEANDWNIQRAAELLGIHRNTLTRKMSDFGLKKPT